jgi:hypothetical protein
MASRCPRIQISPTPDLSVVLQALSKLTGKPQSRVIVELLDEALPALQVMAQALSLAKKSPREAESLMTNMATRSIHALTQEQMNFSEAMKQKPGRKPKGSSGRKP